MVYVSGSVPAAGRYFRPKAPHGFKMANYRGTLVKSLVTRLGSALTLAIAFRNHVFQGVTSVLLLI